MLYRKEGFPEEDEFVFCAVTKIQYNSVFVNLDEYDKVGMIHISEISPGRIRNIRDFVKEGKKIVCKVLRVNKEKEYIDLSLRRVTESQRRSKMSEVQQEQKAEKILEIIAKELNIDLKKLYDDISKKIFEKYPLIYICFEDVANNKFNLEDLKIEKRVEKSLTELIKLRIKPKEVKISALLFLQSYKPEGVNDIKDILKKIEKNSEVLYEGAGRYRITVTSDNYKDAEKVLKKIENNISVYSSEYNTAIKFVRK